MCEYCSLIEHTEAIEVEDLVASLLKESLHRALVANEPKTRIAITLSATANVDAPCSAWEGVYSLCDADGCIGDVRVDAAL